MTAIVRLAANANTMTETSSREFLERQAFEAFKAFVLAFQQLVRGGEITAAAAEPTGDVMTADEAAESSAWIATRSTTTRAAGSFLINA